MFALPNTEFYSGTGRWGMRSNHYPNGVKQRFPNESEDIQTDR